MGQVEYMKRKKSGGGGRVETVWAGQVLKRERRVGWGGTVSEV